MDSKKGMHAIMSAISTIILKTQPIKKAIHFARKELRIKSILVCAAFFFISLSKWFHMPSSFALCCLMALSACNEKLHAALLGTLLGSLFCLVWGAVVPAWTIAAVFASPMLAGIRWKGKWHLSWACAALLLAGIAIEATIRKYTLQDVLLSCTMLAVTWSVMPALCKAVTWLRGNGKSSTGKDDVLCIVFPVMMVLSGMCKTNIWMMNLGYACSVCMVLLHAKLLSGASALCMGFLGGLPFLLSGHGAYWCIVLAVSGGLCGMFQGKKRFVCVILHMLTTSLFSYLLLSTFSLMAFVSSAAGCVIFLLIPEKVSRR